MKQNMYLEKLIQIKVKSDGSYQEGYNLLIDHMTSIYINAKLGRLAPPVSLESGLIQVKMKLLHSRDQAVV